MRRFLLLTLMLTIFAPSLVQVAVAGAEPGVKAAVQFHDHSSHNKQSEVDSSSGDVYITASDTIASVPDRTIEKIDFSWNETLVSRFSIETAMEARAPPGWPGWKDEVLDGQPSLILTTQRFRI